MVESSSKRTRSVTRYRDGSCHDLVALAVIDGFLVTREIVDHPAVHGDPVMLNEGVLQVHQLEGTATTDGQGQIDAPSRDVLHQADVWNEFTLGTETLVDIVIISRVDHNFLAF